MIPHNQRTQRALFSDATNRKQITWRLQATLVSVIVLVLTLSHSPHSQAVSTSVVISQVYGGGGNAGATYNADFVELFNVTTAPILLTGWSIEYAASGGTSWSKTTLDGITIPASGYVLIQEQGGATGLPLPVAEKTGTINLNAISGKVRLMSPSERVDLIGYGTDANESETSPTANLSASKAAIRNANGCTDENINSADFTITTPNPRNSASPLNPCAPPPTPIPTDTETATLTATSTETPTETATETATETSTNTPLPTDTATATITPLPTDTETAVPTATATFTELATETPSETATPTATAIDTATDTAVPTTTPTGTITLLPTDTNTATPTETATSTSTETSTPTETATATETPTPTPMTLVLISEFLVDPNAVNDSAGEWIELVNAGDTPVNLRGWRLSSGSEQFTITVDFILPPGGYMVMTRNGNLTLNGGVVGDLTYTSIQLTNSADEIILWSPAGAEMDRVAWNGGIVVGSTVKITAGRSTERSNLDIPAAWQLGQSAWFGSSGDWGTPGTGYVAPFPTATPTPTVTSTDTVTPTETPTATETATLAASATLTQTATETPTFTETSTPTETATITETPTPTPLPKVLISEFLVDPNAVNDSAGEWIELVNAGDTPVNLNGWRLSSGGEQFTITVDFILSPGGYIVMTRNGDSTLNGGVVGDLTYTSIQLTNSADELVLWSPAGAERDRVAWSGGVMVGSTVKITAGRSIERSNLDIPATWALAESAWLGSSGDFGTPGTGYIAPFPTATTTSTATSTDTITPTPTPTATATETATLAASATFTQTATETPTFTETSTPTETATITETPTPTPLPKLLISEFLADPQAVSDTAGEWIELVNAGSAPVNLRGWRLSSGSEQFTITIDFILPPGGYMVMTRNGDSTLNGGVVGDLTYTSIQLANSTDEIMLWSPAGAEMDRVSWSGGIVVGSTVKITAGKSIERSNLDIPATWALGQSVWIGSAGDWGTPGTGYVAPLPTATPTATPTETIVISATATVSETAIFTATSATPTPLPRIFISEFLADPKAVGDTDGEWVELFNREAYPVNLNGWTLADLGSDHFTIPVDLVIPAGGYILLGRNLSPTLNGGVVIDLAYAGFTLSNTADEILLLAPDNSEIDRVFWGSDLKITAGKSLERTNFDDPPQWTTATTAWLGSLGDWGTPHSAYQPPATQTPTVTASVTTTVTATITATITPTLVTTPTPLPHILISEFLADPKAVTDSNGEWLELVNAGSAPVNLRGWRISDRGSDSFTIPVDFILQPGAYVLLGRNADSTSNGGVVLDIVYTDFGLANSADEIVLSAPDGSQVDSVAWDNQTLLGQSLKLQTGHSIERSNLSDPAQWVIGSSPWLGSAGDSGTPGSAWLPPVATSTPTTTTTLSPTLTPTFGALPKLFLSEFLADPKAVNDTVGEWIELYNGGDAPIHLRGWSIADLGSDQHTIAADLIIPAGGYLVIGRNADPTVNGGVNVAYAYSNFGMTNSSDAILLIAPDGREADRVTWGDGLTTVAGKSYERTAFDGSGTWTLASTQWIGSVGDLGTPGNGYVVQIPTPTPTFGALPKLFLSEFLADPKAMSDTVGEWIELYNGGDAPINLRGWRIADLGSDHHTITADLIIPADGYVVIGRNADPTVNGGVNVAYTYSNFGMTNSGDAILLLAPDGREADRVTWGDGLTTVSGKSYERTAFDGSGAWALAWQPWTGSAGDSGTPGTIYQPSLLPTPTATSSVTTTPVSAPWTAITGNSPLLIEEVNYRGSDEEYIVLQNRSSEVLDLTGWLVGDAEQIGDSEGLYRLPAGQLLAAGDLFVLARNGVAFRQQWGEAADGETDNEDDLTPTLEKAKEYAHGSLSLSDGGDEVVLVNPQGLLADALAFNNGEYALLGLSGSIQTANELSLQRVPGAEFPAEPDVRHRFMIAPLDPFAVRSLPWTEAHLNPQLDGGMIAVWGSMGTASNFSTDGTVPPHYLLAAANLAGLDFAAIADPQPVTPVLIPNGILPLPAWAWQGESDKAVVYSQSWLDEADPAALLAMLSAQSIPAQWRSSPLPTAANLASFAADSVEMPADGNALLKVWRANGPVLPAGNSNPPLPAAISPVPRYTGLAVSALDTASLTKAIAAHRGWLTSSPGFWLTLQAERSDGQRQWMGETLASGSVKLQVQVGDRSGQPASVAIWQDGKPIRQLYSPPADGRWTVDLQLLPNTIVFAVALQADGDFAVTAPLIIPNEPPPPAPPPPPADNDPALPGGKAPDFDSTEGQSGGPPASLAYAKRFGLDVWVEFRARVTVPPGLLGNIIYVADPTADGTTAGIGIQVYLRKGDYPALGEGDFVLLKGFLKTFRGEMELMVENSDYVWKIEPLPPLVPLPVTLAQINEPLEGRLVSLRGVISGWQSDSIFLQDPTNPLAEPVRVTIRTTLPWKRPFVKVGEIYEVTGVISQFAREHPWNGGYRVLVRYKSDLKKVKK